MANEQYGSGTREVVQDPLAPRLGTAKQPNSIPLSGVSSPRGADFSQVGESQRVIAKLLGDASGIADKYVESKRKEWELDGKMAYAQGVAEEELYKTGNKYNMAGFLTMKTQTATTAFLQQEYDNIDKSAREQDPEQYRKELGNRYKKMSEELGNDPFIGRLLGAAAEETFPKLVAQQTKSNNAWRRDQTKLAYRDNLVSRGTAVDPQSPDGGDSPDTLRGLLNPERSGLNLDDHKEVITEALALTLEQKDFRLVNAMTGLDQKNSGTSVKDLPPTKVLADSLVGSILKNELHADGVIRVHADGDGKAIGGINSNSYPEQFAEASRILRDEGQGAAVQYIRGFYQKEIIEKNGIGNLSVDVQDVVSDGLVNHWSGFQKELLGAAKNGATRAELLGMRRNEYMRLAQADPKKYGANLDGWLSRLNKLQDADVNANGVQESAQGFLTEQALAATLQKNGFSTAQISRATSEYRKAQTEKEAAFDKNRYVNEQSLINVAEKEGNLPAQLDAIKSVQIQNGYSDKWADGIAGKVTAAVDKFNVKETEYVRLDSLGTAGQLSNESSDKQKTAIDRERARIIGRVSGNESLTDEQKNQVIRQDMTNFLVNNGVVDPTWEKSITVGLSGDIVRKDGTINPQSLKAYQDYIWLKQNAPAGYAANYAKGPIAKLVAQAEALDINMNSDQALLTAAQMLSRTSNNTDFPVKTADAAEVNKTIDKKITEELNPGIFSFISKFQAADAFDVKDGDIEAAQQSPLLRSALTARANTILAADLNGKMTIEGAVNEAWNSMAGRIELAPSGNVLISGGEKSIREELGFPKAHATNLVFKAMKKFAAKYGKAYFGPNYHGYTENADQQFAIYKVQNPAAGTTGQDERGVFGKTRDFIGGFPPSSLIWDADRKGIQWQLMKEDDEGNMIPDGNPKFIPASLLGDFMREEEFAERSTRSLTDYIKNTTQDISKSIFGKD